MKNIQQLTYNRSNNNERKKKTIMICDDERDVLLLFGLVFGSKYHVIMVDSGEECIDRFMEEKNLGNKIHLMLLDYKMGGMLGDSVARKIKEYPGTKIILNSAYNVDDVLVKRVRKGQLYIKVLTKTN